MWYALPLTVGYKWLNYIILASNPINNEGVKHLSKCFLKKLN